MFLKATITFVLFTAAFLTGCGTSSAGPNGSKAQTSTGVAESGYPGGQPKDPSSPALASSTEQQHSDPGKPKVGAAEAEEKPQAK